MTTATTAPRVVALVPAWNGAEFIVATLDALAAQTYANLEILISDDASRDETAAICERYAARDRRFALLRQPSNLGWAGNVNALLATARGEYFVFAFQDDLLAPDYVTRCVAALEANPRAILAFSDIVLVQKDGSREEKSYAVLDRLTDRLERGCAIARQQGSWWIPNRGVFRARAAGAIGGLKRHLAGEFSADWPWLLQLSLLGEFVRVPERLCTKIYVERSLSRGWNFGARSWSAVTLSAMRAVARSDAAMSEKFALHVALIAFASGRILKSMRRNSSGLLRRLGIRRKSRAATGTASSDAGRFTD